MAKKKKQSNSHRKRRGLTAVTVEYFPNDVLRDLRVMAKDADNAPAVIGAAFAVKWAATNWHAYHRAIAAEAASDAI